MPRDSIDNPDRKARKRRRLWAILLASLIICLGILWYDVLYAPGTIQFEQRDTAYQGIRVTREAEDLTIQQYVEGFGVFASRGYDIYLLEDGGDAFEHVGRLPVPLGLSYLGNSSIARHLFNRTEVLEMMRLDSGTVLAFAGGYIFRAEDGYQDYDFERVGNVEYFGLGTGRGIMPQGYTQNASGEAFWGEYWDNPEKMPVTIWRSGDDGRSWQVAYQFPQGTIRHVHAVQYDRYAGLTWIATGDSDSECRIGYLDQDENFVAIGEGSQEWRAVSLAFTEDWVYWGMDGTSEEHPFFEIWRWNREDHDTESVARVDSAAFYSATAKDRVVITTDGSGDGASIWMTTEGEDWTKRASFSRANDRHFGTLRIVEGPAGSFFVTMHSLKEFNNSLVEISIE